MRVNNSRQVSTQLVGWVTVDWINMDQNIYRYENAGIIPKIGRFMAMSPLKVGWFKKVIIAHIFCLNVASPLHGASTINIKTYRHLVLVWQLMYILCMICIFLYGPGTWYAKSEPGVLSTCQDLHLQPAGDFGVPWDIMGPWESCWQDMLIYIGNMYDDKW